jgi:hypothetical protein
MDYYRRRTLRAGDERFAGSAPLAFPLMARRVRRLVVVVMLLLIAGAVALVLTSRPRLEDKRDEVDRAWTPLRAPLVARYEQLAGVNAQMAAAGAGDRSVTRALGTTLARWDRLRRAGNGDADAGAEAETANQLEGLAARLRAIVQSSDRLRGVDPLNQALAAFQGAVPPLPAVKKYNDAAQEYEDTRNSFLRRPVAGLFGYESRPQLLLAS